MTMQRHIYYSLIHHGIETLLQDRMGYFDEAAYHRTLRTMTGKSSCFNLSDDELDLLVENLMAEGYLEDMKHAIPTLENQHCDR